MPNVTSPATSPSPPPPKRRRRRRPARSCEQCRRRKIRCSLGRPCNGCVRARAPMQCSYRDGSPVESASEVAGVRPLAPVETQTQREEVAAVPERQRNADIQSDIAHYPRDQISQPPRTRTIDNSVPNRNREGLVSEPGPLPQSSASTPISTSIHPFTPRLRHVPDKTKLFGQTHWLHTAEKFDISGNFHPVEIEPSWEDAKSDFYETLKEARFLRFALKKKNSPSLEQPIQDLRETLPTKSVCDGLIACYLRTLEPMYRIIHIPSFWREYDRIWENQQASSVPTVSLVKLTLILAIGTTFASFDNETEINHLWRLAQTWIQNAQWWLTGPNEKTTYNLDGLQVFCLLIIARQATFNCRGATSWLSSGSLLRAAITMGLHRDPKLFPGLSLFQKEFRARLWATVLELAVQSCLDLGLPLNLSESDYDTSAPSNFNDSDLESASPQAPKPMDTFTDSYLQILLAKSLPLRVEVVRLLNDFRHEKTHEKALSIGSQLRTACRDVAAFFHSAKQNDTNPGSCIEANQFHRKVIDIHLRRFIMFLHRDFMLQAKTDPRFYLSRKLCVEAALVIASTSKGVDLNLPLQVWDDMSRLSFVGRGLFKCALSFDAMLILALEVITELQDESAPNHEADVLNEMARASRAPLIQTLEEMYEQLRCMVTRGNTSLKRLLFSNAHLAQIRALESGRPVKPAVYETITQTLRDGVAMMREVQAAATPNESVVTTDSLSTDFFGPDLFSTNNLMEWDISDLLGFPTMGRDGQAQWPQMD
ncbi:hypothetical protein FSARC_2298 [Fusarium sarcochroum]|uniref:Zn(2)-C6 fungal-type domain-containing protein n=1 Tax=Fusarium sarcochroum TaxID=1208366 RepID=A0A8H4XDZ8_9HYPO|nr:hypothetical protein FSARC_2298 [Fusarium sarcochroum]